MLGMHIYPPWYVTNLIIYDFLNLPQQPLCHNYLITSACRFGVYTHWELVTWSCCNNYGLPVRMYVHYNTCTIKIIIIIVIICQKFINKHDKTSVILFTFLHSMQYVASYLVNVIIIIAWARGWGAKHERQKWEHVFIAL